MCDTRNGHTTIHSWELINATERQKSIMLAILTNRRRKKYGNKDGNPLSVEDIKEFLHDISEEELDELVDIELLRKTACKYELTNSKIRQVLVGYTVCICLTQRFF